MMPVALKKDRRLEGEVGLSMERTDTVKRKHQHGRSSLNCEFS